MTIKEIREKLQVIGTKFNINGKLSYQKGPDGEYGDYPAVFTTMAYGKNGKTDSISKGFFGGMNVTKFGPTCVTLYDFNLLGKKTIGKINYATVKILEVGEEGN